MVDNVGRLLGETPESGPDAQHLADVRRFEGDDPVDMATDLVEREFVGALSRMSRGRLEAGFVRGVPYEISPANSNPVRMLEREYEALDLIVKAWTNHDGTVSFEGRFFHARQINIWPRPYQQPHPPVWVSTTSPSGAARVGSRGFVQATFLTGYEGTRKIYDSYRKGWRAAGNGQDIPVNRLAYAALVYVGRSEAEVREALAGHLCRCGTHNRIVAAVLRAGQEMGRT